MELFWTQVRKGTMADEGRPKNLFFLAFYDVTLFISSTRRIASRQSLPNGKTMDLVDQFRKKNKLGALKLHQLIILKNIYAVFNERYEAQLSSPLAKKAVFVMIPLQSAV